MCLKGEANMNSEPPPDLPELQIDEVVQGCGPEGSLLALEAGFFYGVPPATTKQE